MDTASHGIPNTIPGIVPYPNVTEQHIFPKSDLIYPWTHFHRESLIPGISDPVLSAISPFAAYWLMSGIFALLDEMEWPFFEKYRLHESAEVKARNTVTRLNLIKHVLLQQFFQTGLALWAMSEQPSVLETDHAGDLFTYSKWIGRAVMLVLGPQGKSLWSDYGAEVTWWVYWWVVPLLQFLGAFFLLDTWQYFLHRYFHTNKFLYRHIHSWHHRLYVPYSYGALYNHPIEGFLFDSVGTALAHALCGMTIRQAVLLFGICSAKTVDDHSGYALPFDPFQILCGNNADYHDIHHQTFGIKKNFAQPWFTHWDQYLGTRMRRSEAPKRGSKALKGAKEE